jgi:hypothetical protein
MECRGRLLKESLTRFSSVFQRTFHTVLPGDVLLQVVWRQADGGLFKERVSRDFISVFQRGFHTVLPGDLLLQVIWRQADGGLFKERVSRDFLLFFSGDFIQSCPAMCSCKWSGGKQTVDCSSQSFTAIPTTLGQEVKVRIAW